VPAGLRERKKKRKVKGKGRLGHRGLRPKSSREKGKRRTGPYARWPWGGGSGGNYGSPEQREKPGPQSRKKGEIAGMKGQSHRGKGTEVQPLAIEEKKEKESLERTNPGGGGGTKEFFGKKAVELNHDDHPLPSFLKGGEEKKK